jgi:hypothetical protein
MNVAWPVVSALRANSRVTESAAASSWLQPTVTTLKPRASRATRRVKENFVYVIMQFFQVADMEIYPMGYKFCAWRDENGSFGNTTGANQTMHCMSMVKRMFLM